MNQRLRRRLVFPIRWEKNIIDKIENGVQLEQDLNESRSSMANFFSPATERRDRAGDDMPPF